MNIKFKDFVSNKVFLFRIGNFLSLVAAITIAACALNSSYFFYSIISSGYYERTFTLILAVFLSVMAILVYFVVSASIIKKKSANYFKNTVDLFFVDKKISLVNEGLVDVSLLILDEIDYMESASYERKKNGVSHEDFVAKGLSSTLYLIDVISNNISGMYGKDYFSLLNKLPEIILNRAVRFCEFKSISLDLVSSNGSGYSLSIRCQDDSMKYIKGDGVDKLVRGILVARGSFVNCEYMFSGDSGVDGGSPVSAKIIISKNEISLKIS